MTTKREDLESIIEDPEILKGLDLKSQANQEEEVLVVHSEDECEDEMEDDEEGKGKKKKMSEESPSLRSLLPSR